MKNKIRPTISFRQISDETKLCNLTEIFYQLQTMHIDPIFSYFQSRKNTPKCMLDSLMSTVQARNSLYSTI